VDRPDHLGQSVSDGSEPSILCIGGAVIDRLYEAEHGLGLQRSNPVRGRVSLGGVARNVAEVLVQLGARAKLASLVGTDTQGLDLLAQCKSNGIDVSLVKLHPEARTGEYMGVFEGPELFAAFADMEIFERLDASFVADTLEKAGKVKGLFADCNLSDQALGEIIAACAATKLPLAIDTVSVAKAKRLEQLNAKGVILFTNREEAKALTNHNDPQWAVGCLLNRGAAAVIISDGAAGVYAGDTKGSLHLAMRSDTVVNVSGAGDALAAGTYLRWLEGAELEEAVAFGMGCAQAALQWPSARPVCFTRREAEQRSKSLLAGGRT
jgi:pseudouridine kinase